MRPTFCLPYDNSRPSSLTRRGFISGIAVVALAARLSAQQRHRRIVSTAPSITEALFALELGDQVVGVSRFCAFPDSVRKLPKVGTYLQPDAEAIARLLPDLVILEPTSSELTGRLNALHIKFIEVPEGTLSDIYTAITLIAEAAAVPDRAAVLNQRIQRELTSLHEHAKGLPSPRVLAIVGRGSGMLTELTAVGPDNYLEQLLEIVGGTNVLAKPGLPMYPRISFESVLREDPDVILDLSGHQESEAARKAESAQALALWSRQLQLSAVRKGRVVVGTSNALVVPGPRAPEAARLLFDYIHSTNTGGRAN